jgi:Zn-dependent protease
MNPSLAFAAVIQLLLLWLGISIHEAAHAWAAARAGDPTARDLGRATLNPLRHLDPFGALLFPCLLLAFGLPVFGWGRPTPVVEAKLRTYGRGGFFVFAAGPLANLLVTAVAVIAIAVAANAMGEPARDAALQILVGKAGAEHLGAFPVMFTLVRLATINAFLAAFNLIPLPPLDGGQLALRLLPPDWAARLAATGRYGFMIAVAIAVMVLPWLFIPFYGILGLVIQFS